MDPRAGINHTFISRCTILLTHVGFQTKLAVFLQVVFVYVGVLMELSDAGTARIHNTTDVSCSLKEQATLTKCLLRLSLKDFVSTKLELFIKDAVILLFPK